MISFSLAFSVSLLRSFAVSHDIVPSTPVGVPFGHVVYNTPSALPDAWHSTVWRPHELGPDAFVVAVLSQQPLSRDI